MRALSAAQLLRLRTLRSPRWTALVGLVAVAAITASNIRADATWAPGELGEALGAIALTGVLLAAAFAGSIVGSAFHRGELPMTYLTYPRRTSAAAAHALVHAGLGFLFAGLAAGTVVAVGLSIARGGDVTTADVVQLVGGAAAGGAAMSGAGVLLGIVTRHATIAAGAIVALNTAEALVSAHGVRTYLPFHLLQALMGMPDSAPPGAALLVLLAYLAAFALVVWKWALPRDLT